MTEQSQTLLHAWLIEDAGDGRLFLADIERMLASLVAARQGKALDALPAPDAQAASSERFFVVPADAKHRLLLEVGVHRAQVVPADSETGRIVTSTVGVELLDPGARPTTGKPRLPVVKTYNYVQRTVMRHATGERLMLDAVISGQA